MKYSLKIYTQLIIAFVFQVSSRILNLISNLYSIDCKNFVDQESISKGNDS